MTIHVHHLNLNVLKQIHLAEETQITENILLISACICKNINPQ